LPLPRSRDINRLATACAAYALAGISLPHIDTLAAMRTRQLYHTFIRLLVATAQSATAISRASRADNLEHVTEDRLIRRPPPMPNSYYLIPKG